METREEGGGLKILALYVLAIRCDNARSLILRDKKLGAKNSNPRPLAKKIFAYCALPICPFSR